MMKDHVTFRSKLVKISNNWYFKELPKDKLDINHLVKHEEIIVPDELDQKLQEMTDPDQIEEELTHFTTKCSC